MIFALIQDYADVLTAMPTEQRQRRILSLLDEAIRRNVQFIDRHPTTLFQCLWNSCWWYGCPDAAGHYEAPVGEWPAAQPLRKGADIRLFFLMETWRTAKDAHTPGFPWVRSLRPPPEGLNDPLRFVLRGHSNSIEGVVYSADGHRLASASFDRTVRVWDTATGQQLACLCHETPVRCVAFSPDGTRLAAAGDDAVVRIWDIGGSQPRASLRGHQSGPVYAVAFSPDGQRVASAGSDDTIRLWHPDDGRPLACFAAQARGVFSLAYSPDGRRLASGGFDRNATIWHADTGARLASLAGSGRKVESLAWSPDGRLLAGGASGGRVTLWDVVSGRADPLVGESDVSSSVPSGVAVSPDGKWLASAGGDRTVRLFDLVSRRQVAAYRGHEFFVRSLAFSPSGNSLASGGGDGVLRIWSVVDGDRSDELCLLGRAQPLRALGFSPDGARLACTQIDGAVRAYDAYSGLPVSAVEWPAGTSAVCYASGGQRMLTVETDGVRLRDIATGLEVTRLGDSAATYECISFSQDGRRVVGLTKGRWGTGTDRAIVVWDTESGERLARLPESRYREERSITCVACSPDGSRIAVGFESTGDWSHYVEVRDATGPTVVARLEKPDRYLTARGATKGVREVAFSPDGGSVASFADDKKLRLWDIAERKCLLELEGESDVTALAGGAERWPWRLLCRQEQCAVESSATGAVAGWFPAAIVQVSQYPALMRTHPSGRIWARAVTDHFYLVALEGDPVAF